MSINLRTPEQIAKMRVAGKLAAEVLELIGEHVVAGASTEDLDRICHEHIVQNQKPYLPASATEAFQNLFAPLWTKLCATAFPQIKKY